MSSTFTPKSNMAAVFLFGDFKYAVHRIYSHSYIYTHKLSIKNCIFIFHTEVRSEKLRMRSYLLSFIPYCNKQRFIHES